MTPLQKIARKTVITAEGCAQYTGVLNNSGYGICYAEGRNRSVHRYAYETLVGPIAKGLELDHLCRNRACWNVAHMEPVTTRENQKRGHWGMKTHCPADHAYTEENTYVTPKGKRRCRECARIRGRAADLAKKLRGYRT